ncbi:SoxR-reducing system protein RseC [Pantoea sp. 1.19]|uniref:SoxR-reducing system protein RseC n=1 Tax=Pantoea sp. 1.19 TaxID=1925589 RepID=UPI000948FDEB|nr:SoxR-reducing system protein RseC [Pantoea sp. 1.19]
MIKEWATVVAWHNGVATVHAESKTSCNSCSAKGGCGSAMLNKLGPKNAHVMTLRSEQPLQPGQRVELGIRESSLLGSAMLVYLAPLVGLFLVAGLFQALFHSDLAAATGALLGGVAGFILARGVAGHFGQRLAPVILSVTLPPDALRVDLSDR